MFLELREFEQAVRRGDRVNMLDALVDLVYVALGTALLLNFPFYEAWKLVHSANMKKIRARSKTVSKRGSTFDVVKPRGWKMPNISSLLS